MKFLQFVHPYNNRTELTTSKVYNILYYTIPWSFRQINFPLDLNVDFKPTKARLEYNICKHSHKK